VNIQNVLFWLECRHRYVCATSHPMASSTTLSDPLQPTHQSDAASNHLHPALLPRYWIMPPDVVNWIEIMTVRRDDHKSGVMNARRLASVSCCAWHLFRHFRPRFRHIITIIEDWQRVSIFLNCTSAQTPFSATYGGHVRSNGQYKNKRIMYIRNSVKSKIRSRLHSY